MKNYITFLFVLLFVFFSTASFSKEENPYKDYRIKTYSLQEEYLTQIVEHQSKVMTDMENKLIQQEWQTNVIAVMVFFMVGMGLYLSYLQFKRDKNKKENSAMSLKLGAGSIEISSPVIGLIILALSFWFFQTYVDKVYSVNVFNIPLIDLTTFGVNK